MAETTELTKTEQFIQGNCYLECTLDGQVIKSRNIAQLVIREWVFDEQRVPRLELQIMDDGVFTDSDYPYQGKIFTVKVKREKGEDDDQYLEAEFIILDSEWEKPLFDSQGNPSVLAMSGILKSTKPFETITDKCYENKTSNEVCEEIAGVIGAGFNSNKNGQDRMNWITKSNSPMQMVAHVCDRAFAGPDDCFFCYLDVKNVLNFTSIKEAWNGAPIKAIRDVDIASLNVKDKIISEAKIKKGYSENEALSTLWYSNMDVKNSGGSDYIRKGGYGYSVRWIDFEESSFALDTAGKNTTSCSSAEKMIDNQQIFLTGKENPSEIAPKYVDNNDFICYMKKGTNQNVYGQDYFYNTRRRQNITTVFSAQSILIEVNPIAPVSLMDVVDLEVPSNITIEENPKNEVLGGQYLVMGIVYSVDGNHYKKLLSLHRVGWNSSNILKKG